MKMDIGSSQSWWWESHNRPKHSKWLQENLADVETNVKSILTLIEGDADSFAQRAEMYYKKRPDLLKVVEQFYRGYRALAERYDQMSGSVRQIPAALQAQYGLTTESPRTSPFGGKHVTFKKQDSGMKGESYSESNNESGDFEADGESAADAFSADEKSQEHSDSSSSSSSDVEFDGASLEIQRLHKVVEDLQAENKKITERSREKLQQYRETEKRLHGFREDFLKAQKESNTLKVELSNGEKLRKELEEQVRQLHLENEVLRREMERNVAELRDELVSEKETGRKTVKDLQEQMEAQVMESEKSQEKQQEFVAALRLMKGAALGSFRRNKVLLKQISSMVEVQEAKEQLMRAKNCEVERLGRAVEARQETVQALNIRVAELSGDVLSLRDENDKQRLAVAECAEEKREVIRQLCYTIDLMNDRNQWLEGMLLTAKSKLNECQKMVAAKSSGWGVFSG